VEPQLKLNITLSFEFNAVDFIIRVVVCTKFQFHPKVHSAWYLLGEKEVEFNSQWFSNVLNGGGTGMKTTYVNVKFGRFKEYEGLAPKAFMNDTGHKGLC
jgi:hypothetical protein